MLSVSREKVGKTQKQLQKTSKENPVIVRTTGFLVRHEGLEPPTFAFVVRYSIQLS